MVRPVTAGREQSGRSFCSFCNWASPPERMSMSPRSKVRPGTAPQPARLERERRLTPLEIRLALLQERRDALLKVLGPEQQDRLQ